MGAAQLLPSRPGSVPSPAPLWGNTPQELTRAFAAALSAAQLDRAVSLFATDGCFVTPDATALRGHQDIRSILAQLTAGRVQLRIALQKVHTAARLALCNERWTFIYSREDAAPFERASDSAVLLRRSNRAWELLIVAPWGIADADRHPFAAMPWPS